jgi:1,3-propanediol dehydrogenase/alcohol dehydrogenase
MPPINEFRLPEVTHFGWGAVERVGEEAARIGKRALLVTGRSAMKRAGVTDRVCSLLRAAGVDVVTFDKVEADPSSATIQEGAKVALREKRELVIGLGGGSPMDAARAIAAMAVLDGHILDYTRGKPVDRPGLPLINIATTAGTASEITPFAVVLDEGRKLKIGIKSIHWFARAAITDPELTLTMSPELTAATGLDALTHAVESYLSTGATPPSEALALKAVELIGANLCAAVADGTNRQAREGMALASMSAGMAFANSGLGLVHGLVHPIGARFGLPHGLVCGRLLPAVLRFNLPAAEGKLTHVARALTGKEQAGADDAIAAVEALLRAVGVPTGIADLQIPADQVPSLAEDGLVAGAVRTNPRPVSKDDARAVLDQAREG